MPLGIATQVYVIKVKVTVTKTEIQFSLNNFCLLWPIVTKLGVWVAYIKTQLGIATQVYVIKVKVTVTKIEIQFPLNNLCLLWPIYTKLGACNQCSKNNGIIFSSLPSFISYSCHINTWLNRWKPGFVALRRFLFLYIFTISLCVVMPFAVLFYSGITMLYQCDQYLGYNDKRI